MTKYVILKLLTMATTINMIETETPTTLQTLLSMYSSPAELASAIDRAMLCMVLLLRYEPESLETISESYESLYELKNVILNQANNNHGH